MLLYGSIGQRALYNSGEMRLITKLYGKPGAYYGE